MQKAPKCDDATLSAALRRYDLDGYGLVRPGVFDLALDACRVTCSRQGREAEVLRGLDYALQPLRRRGVGRFMCALATDPITGKQKTPLAEITATYDHEAQCFLADARAFKKRLADACERLDVSGLGALHGDAFALACRDAGLAAPSTDVLCKWRRLRDDGRHDARLLLDLDGAGASD